VLQLFDDEITSANPEPNSMQQSGWLQRYHVFLIFVLSLFGNNLNRSCRAFHTVGTTNEIQPTIHQSRVLTPKMTATPSVMKVGLPVGGDIFNLDQWQAGGITSFSQTCFAEYWHDLPSIVSDTERSDNKDDDIASAAIVMDPYNFRHRMAMEKCLIEHTGGESIWGSMGDVKCSKHTRWGYAAQLDWQYRSGRFEDPSKWQDDDAPFDQITTKTDTISKRSWWGKMNLSFSVASYCGAADAGLVPPISLSDESVSNDVGFQTCVGIWKKFWETDHVAFVASYSSSKDEEERQTLTVALYRALWATHTDIIKSSVQQGKDLEVILPKEDRNAGLGWCTMVELLSATNWPLLSLDSLCKFGAGYLPTARIAGPRTLQWLKENRRMEYTTANSLYQLKDAPEKAMSIACGFFGRVARWRFAMNNLPRSLHVLTHGNPVQKILALSRVVILAAFPR